MAITTAAKRHSPVCLGINWRALRDTLHSQRVLPAVQQEVKPRTNNPLHGLLFRTNVLVRAFAYKRTWILRDRSLLGVPVISLRCAQGIVVHKNCGLLSGTLHIGVQANWRQKELRKYVDIGWWSQQHRFKSSDVLQTGCGIANVATYQNSGGCFVESCSSGYKPNEDQTQCESAPKSMMIILKTRLITIFYSVANRLRSV